MWVIHRVHDDTSHLWSSSKMSGSTGFSERDIHVILVSENSQGSVAFAEHHSHFARRKTKSNIVTFLGYHCCTQASAPDKLSATSIVEFDVVNCKSKGNVLQRKSVSCCKRCIWTGHNLCSNCKPLRCKNVALFTICIEYQSNQY